MLNAVGAERTGHWHSDEDCMSVQSFYWRTDPGIQVLLVNNQAGARRQTQAASSANFFVFTLLVPTLSFHCSKTDQPTESTCGC